MLHSMLFWGLTLGLVGKVLLGATVIMVHSKITHEKHIDGIVLMEMKRERVIALFAISLIVLGYILEIGAYGYLAPFITGTIGAL